MIFPPSSTAPSLSNGIGFFSHAGHVPLYKRCTALHRPLRYPPMTRGFRLPVASTNSSTDMTGLSFICPTVGYGPTSPSFTPDSTAISLLLSRYRCRGTREPISRCHSLGEQKSSAITVLSLVLLAGVPPLIKHENDGESTFHLSPSQEIGSIGNVDLGDFGSGLEWP